MPLEPCSVWKMCDLLLLAVCVNLLTSPYPEQLLFNRELRIQATRTVKVPVLQPASKCEFMDIPMLDPHVVLHYLLEEVGLKTDPNLIRNYWQHAAAHNVGWATAQPNQDAVPVGIYADATKYGLQESQEKVLGIFINFPLFRPADIRLSRYLKCVIRTKQLMLPGNRTLLQIFERIVWSMGWAAKGLFPDKDMDGSPLPDRDAKNAGRGLGAQFLVTELRGDLEWHKLIWAFPDWWKATRVCFFCNATKTGRDQQLLFTNTGESAGWRATIYRDLLPWMLEKLPLDNLCILFYVYQAFASS